MNTVTTIPTMENSIMVSIAQTPEEKMEVYRFRYRVYIEEMNLQIETANHRIRVVSDELDKNAILLYAKASGKIIGTQRINIGRIDDFPSDLARFLCLEKFQNYFSNQHQAFFAYTSKLMVASHYRNSPVLHLLTAKGYELYSKYNVPFNFGVCNFHLLRLYEQFGCRRYVSSFTAPGYDGILTPFVLLVDDIRHLRAVRSPFYRLARRKENLENQTADWLYSKFPESFRVINSQLTSTDSLWSLLHTRLGAPPEQSIPLLQGLAITDAKKFLSDCGILISCRPGEQITSSTSTSHTLKILVSGSLLAKSHYGFEDVMIKPGQGFGATGMVSPAQYEQDFFAATDTEVLVLSRLSFERFRLLHPQAADIIIVNIGNTPQKANI